jgi:hypothetical protein
MTITQKQLDRIAVESSEWVDKEFTNLDTRGLPLTSAQLQDAENDGDAFNDPAWAHIDGRGPGAGRLKLEAFLQNPDAETLEALSSEHPEQRAELERFSPKHPHRFFPAGEGEATVFFGNDNVWTVTFADGSSARFPSAKTREGAMMAATRYRARQRGPQVRDLTADEKLYVARLAGKGDLTNAICNYLYYAVQDYDGQDISSDSRYRKVCDDCGWFVFVHATPQFQDGDEVRKFMASYCGSRPITVSLLQYAHKAWLENLKKSERGLLYDKITPPDSEPSAEGIEDLSDSAVSDLYKQTLRDARNPRGR